MNIENEYLSYFRSKGVHVMTHGTLIIAVKIAVPGTQTYSIAEATAFRVKYWTEAFEKLERFANEA